MFSQNLCYFGPKLSVLVVDMGFWGNLDAILAENCYFFCELWRCIMQLLTNWIFLFLKIHFIS